MLQCFPGISFFTNAHRLSDADLGDLGPAIGLFRADEECMLNMLQSPMSDSHHRFLAMRDETTRMHAFMCTRIDYVNALYAGVTFSLNQLEY